MEGCPKALGTGECNCATSPWITGLLARLTAELHAEESVASEVAAHGREQV